MGVIKNGLRWIKVGQLDPCYTHSAGIPDVAATVPTSVHLQVAIPV